MVNRREHLLDTALRLIGERGIHGLTHRTLDAAAGLPAGSASNHFRTREALLNGVVKRFAEREKANWDELATQMCPTSPQELARTMAEAAKQAVTTHRTLTLARYAILVEAAIHPSLRAQLATTGAQVSAWATNWVRIAGSPDPQRHAPVIMNHFAALILHELAIPDPQFDPYPQIETLVTTLIGARTAEVSP
jgi:DNA-binding transcriptional regulator YbjK